MASPTSMSSRSPQAVLAMRSATTAKNGAPLGALRHHLTLPSPGGIAPTTYAVDLAPEDDGTFRITCPELPEIRAFGEDEEEALAMAQQAIEETLGARRIRLAAVS